MKIFVIPDMQVKPGLDLEHLTWIGQYMVDKRPEVIVNLGDWADMESLSSYDRGKKSFEGRRYKADITAGKEAMKLLLKPLRDLQEKQKQQSKKQYKPRMILTVGNHEDRIDRAVEMAPELDGALSIGDLEYEKDWEVYPFRVPVTVEGISFCHFFYNPYSGNPFGGSIDNILKHVGRSFVQGHRQGLFISNRYLPDGQAQWGIIAGSAYRHDEVYKGPQANTHFRGVLMLHKVANGNCDPMIISLDYLQERHYEKISKSNSA